MYLLRRFLFFSVFIRWEQKKDVKGGDRALVCVKKIIRTYRYCT